MHRNAKLYEDLFNLYCQVYTNKPKKVLQGEVNEKWSKIKISKKGPIDEVQYRNEIQKLKLIMSYRISKAGILSFITRVS